MESSLTTEAPVAPFHQRTSFHLSGLPHDVTLDELNQAVGHQYNCKIELLPPRANALHSRVSALLRFDNSDSAQEFFAKKQYVELRDEEYCLTWHQQHFNKEIRKWNLFVEGIPTSWKSSNLGSFFSEIGSVLSCKVEKKREGSVFKNIGWVQMADEVSSKNAILSLNGKQLSEQGQAFTLRVAFSQHRKQCSVHVSNIPASLYSQSSLMDLFSQFGEIESVSLKAETMHPYAFVNFYTQSAAQSALQGANNLELPNSEPNHLEVHPHTSHYSPGSPFKASQAGHAGYHQHKSSYSKAQYQDSNLSVQPIPDSVEESSLREQFEQFGTIKSVLLLSMKQQPGYKRGYVLFDKSQQAFNAIRKMDGAYLWNVRLSVRLYQSHQQRHKYDNISSTNYNSNPIQNLFTNLYQLMYSAQAYQSQGAAQYHPPNNYDYRQRGGYRPRGHGMNRGRGFYNRAPPSTGLPGLQQRTVIPGPRVAPPLSSYEALPGHPEKVQNESIQQAQESSLVNKLAVMNQGDRKQYIGNLFYPKVEKQYPAFAGKITGMLVDIPLEQAVVLLSDDLQLQKITTEAYEQLVAAANQAHPSQ